MNNDDGLLDFLTDDLVGRERDAVTRAFYGYATGEARADWITIGLLAGLILAALLSQLPWWGALIALTAVIGSVQGVYRYPWNSRASSKSN